MVFLTNPPGSLKLYDSVSEPTNERFESFSLPVSVFTDGDVAEDGVAGDAKGPSPASDLTEGSSEGGGLTLGFARFFSPGGNGFSSSR